MTDDGSMRALENALRASHERLRKALEAVVPHLDVLRGEGVRLQAIEARSALAEAKRLAEPEEGR